MSGEQRMVKFTINGREAEFEEGTSVLEAAKALEIEIPTLCFNEAVSPYGACRLCVVEVAAGGRKRLTASCTLPVEEGIESRHPNRSELWAHPLFQDARAAESVIARCATVPPGRGFCRGKT